VRNCEAFSGGARFGLARLSYVFVLVILIRAWRGELPVEMSSQGVKYVPVDEPSADISTLLALLDRFDALADRLEERD
jgi:hypothetical protein